MSHPPGNIALSKLVGKCFEVKMPTLSNVVLEGRDRKDRCTQCGGFPCQQFERGFHVYADRPAGCDWRLVHAFLHGTRQLREVP